MDDSGVRQAAEAVAYTVVSFSPMIGPLVWPGGVGAWVDEDEEEVTDTLASAKEESQE